MILVDVAEDVLARAEVEMRRNTRLHHLVTRTSERLDVDRVLDRVELTVNHERLADAEFVIENITENWSSKRAVYARLGAICAADVPLAANTSAIPIAKIASATRHPERLIGMHFMNPVPLKPAVEVVSGRDTSKRTFALAMSLLTQMGKEAIVVGDSPGFVSNRVLMLAVNEAAYLVEERVAAAEDVDAVFKRCFGHPMGLLETADLIGLDTVLRSLVVLQEELADEKFRPCPLLRSMVDAGTLGRKSGSGFYDYGVMNSREGDHSVDQ